MEKSFDSSAKNMEKSMDSVNKKVSAMQLFHLGARGVGMLGGAAQNIMRLNGNVEDAESLGNAVNVAQGEMQGAAVGFAAAGAWGAAAGALVQARAFATVYQEIIAKIASGEDLPAVLDSVLQPHVEVYKKNLKPQADGKDVVVAGRIS